VNLKPQVASIELNDLVVSVCVYADAYEEASERVARLTRELATAHADEQYAEQMLSASQGMLTLSMEHHAIYRHELGDMLSGMTVAERPKHRNIGAWLWSLLKKQDRVVVRHVAPLPAGCGSAGTTHDAQPALRAVP
jgi:hypothetical protein